MTHTIKETESFELIQDIITKQTRINKKDSFLNTIWGTPKFSKTEIEIVNNMTYKEFDAYCELQLK